MNIAFKGLSIRADANMMSLSVTDWVDPRTVMTGPQLDSVYIGADEVYLNGRKLGRSPHSLPKLTQQNKAQAAEEDLFRTSLRKALLVELDTSEADLTPFDKGKTVLDAFNEIRGRLLQVIQAGRFKMQTNMALRCQETRIVYKTPPQPQQNVENGQPAEAQAGGLQLQPSLAEVRTIFRVPQIPRKVSNG